MVDSIITDQSWVIAKKWAQKKIAFHRKKRGCFLINWLHTAAEDR